MNTVFDSVERFRERYTAGEPLLLTLINIPSPAWVEMACLLGADMVVIDAEHGPMGYETSEHMVRTANSHNVPALIRLPFPDITLINRALDTGAAGILIPHFNSKALAEAAVKASKFAPEGERGAGSISRAGQYGFWDGEQSYSETANASTLVFGILEDGCLADSLDEILEVDGVDGFLVGHSDLSHSLGVPGQVRHPLVQNFLEQITSKVLASGKILCRIPRGGEPEALGDAEDFLREGVQLLGVSCGSYLAWGSSRLRDLIHEAATSVSSSSRPTSEESRS